MGAANALAAYRTYSAIVGSQALHVLVVMCLGSLDDDTEPWYQRGPEVLSEMALGRKIPDSDGTDQGDKDRKAALRRVERAITELLDAGAIRTVVAAADGRRARYRLYSAAPHSDDRPAPNARQKASGVTPDENCRESPANARHFLAQRPTVSGTTPDKKCRAKEKEEKGGDPPTPSTPLRRASVAGAKAGEGKPSPTAKEHEAFVEEIHAARGDWPRAGIRRQIDAAAAKHGWPLAQEAMRLMAADAAVYSPGRLATPGPWVAQARKQLARQDIPEWCRHCWGPDLNQRFIGDEDHPKRCPECHPNAVRRAV